jgi:uncharacterized protein (DUF2236 family)
MAATTPVAQVDKKGIVGAAIMAGGANVIMQLARPAVRRRVRTGRRLV